MTQKRDIPNDYFKAHFRFLKLFGISTEPVENSFKGIMYKIYGLSLFGLCFVLYIISELMYIITSGDLDNATFALSYFLTQTVGVMKVVIVFVFRNEMNTFCKTLETEPFYPDANRSGEKEIVYVKHAIKICNLQGYIFSCFVVMVVFQRYLSVLREPGYDKIVYDSIANTTIVQRVRLPAYYIALPFDQTSSPYYEIALLYQLTSTATIGFVIGPIDAIICGLMCHIRAQLLILKDCTRTYIERAIFLMEKELGSFAVVVETKTQIKSDTKRIEKIPNKLQKYVNVCVSDLIRHHQKILELAENIETTFSMLMLAQFLVSLGLICFSLFQLSLYKIPSIKFFSMVCYLLVMLFQLSLFCWYGNEVMLHSTGIADAVYGSNWIVTDINTQKTLLLMMMRAQKPIKFTAGKFNALSLESLAAIIRGSASYLMVLKKMNPEEI